MKHHRAGRVAQAEFGYRQMLEVEPANADALYALGQVAAARGDHAEAVRHFETLVANRPEIGRAWRRLGRSRLACGALPAAVDAYCEAIERDGDTAELYRELGQVLLKLGLVDYALATFDVVRTLVPGEKGSVPASVPRPNRTLGTPPRLPPSHAGLAPRVSRLAAVAAAMARRQGWRRVDRRGQVSHWRFLALIAALSVAWPAAGDEAAAPAPSSCVPSLAVVSTVDSPSALDFRCSCGCQPNGTAVLGRLLDERFGPADLPDSIGSLFVGRLEEQLPELAEAVALAATRAPGWDGVRAWNDPAYANRFVRDLLNAQDAPSAPLRALFARRNLRLEAAAVEKVLTAVPADLPYGDSLLRAGADPGERVPFDAIVWFDLIPGTDAATQSGSDGPD